MLNKDKSRRTYKHIDPAKLPPPSELPPYDGTVAACLADALLDIIQIAVEAGVEQKDVDAAMKTVADTLADQERHRFRLHVRDHNKETTK